MYIRSSMPAHTHRDTLVSYIHAYAYTLAYAGTYP